LRIARVLRVNIARRGEADLILRLCGLAAILAPLQLLGGIAHLVIPVIGFIGAYQIVTLMRRGPKAVRQIAADYATIARHGEKLGLQASIGVDLSALIRGWIMKPPQSEDTTVVDFGPLQPRLFFWIVPGCLALLWGLGLYAGLPVKWPNWITEFSRDPQVVSPNSIIKWGVLGLWCLLTVTTAILLMWPKDNIDRILLIIDDLDRCLPAESIDILEALKLLLEDLALAARIQVLALVDEEPLGVAIREKFKSIIENRDGDAEAIVREHKEKLFLCALRLPELSPNEIKELITSYTESLTNAKFDAPITRGFASVTASTPGQPSAYEVVTDITREPEPKSAESNKIIRNKPALDNAPRELFTQLERQILREAVVKALPPNVLAPTPRQIRAFLTKYQLARALCRYRIVQNSDTARLLAEGLAHAVFGNSAPTVDMNSDDRRFSIGQVIAEVV
jgi:hypothetical protein